jgi:ATP-dependent exoDNAse (exonuclease V) alpha subunit
LPGVGHFREQAVEIALSLWVQVHLWLVDQDHAGLSARLPKRLEEPDHDCDGGPAPRSVLVVDEAGMVGTRDLAWLIDATIDAGAKLVLVGDDRQLPEIEAGGLFSALAGGLGALELTQVRRQHEQCDRDALWRPALALLGR